MNFLPRTSLQNIIIQEQRMHFRKYICSYSNNIIVYRKYLNVKRSLSKTYKNTWRNDLPGVLS